MTEEHVGRPLFANMGQDTQPGCQTKPLTRDREWGGRHPLGPSVALNSNRYAAPDTVSPGHPGVNVHTAGMVDRKGAPIPSHPAQEFKHDYYAAGNRWHPPDFVIDKGAMFVCHNPSVLNIMLAPFPTKMHGSLQPADELLEIFWDLHHASHPALVRAKEQGNVTFESCRELVLSLFSAMETDTDPEQAELARAVLNTNMLTLDSLDKSVAEEDEIERRAYGKRSVEKQGEMWVLEPRQALKDISQEQRKVHAMVDTWNKRQRATIVDRGYVAQRAGMPHDCARDVADCRERHASAVAATVRLGLQRFETAYSSKKKRASIPAGWFDVCHKGLREALRSAADIGATRSERDAGRAVDPQDSDAKMGTANIGFAHNQRLIANDLSLWGHWRAFLMHMFSSGVRISGPDVHIMLEGWIHAFEPCAPPAPLRAPPPPLAPAKPHAGIDARTCRFQEVSFFYLMCVHTRVPAFPRSWVATAGGLAGAEAPAPASRCVPSACSSFCARGG